MFRLKITLVLILANIEFKQVLCRSLNNKPLITFHRSQSNDLSVFLKITNHYSSRLNNKIGINTLVKNLFDSRNNQDEFKIHFSNYFNSNQIVMIYPKTINLFNSTKRGVFVTALKNGQKVVVKLEKNTDVRSYYDLKKNLITCKSKDTHNEIAVEHYVASLVNSYGYKGFIKYYSDKSKPIFFKNGLILNFYVYDFIPNSKNLIDWTVSQRQNSQFSVTEFESKLSDYFLQIHNALSQLYLIGFAYTDFKPENALVNEHGKVYLIDLESVMSTKMNNSLCLRTKSYAPPFYRRNFLVSFDEYHDGIQNLKTTLHERILTWTFCFSIYSLACLNHPTHIFSKNFKEIFKIWTKENQMFTDVFPCSSSSIKLKNLLNDCLVREQKFEMFLYLKYKDWFNNTN